MLRAHAKPSTQSLQFDWHRFISTRSIFRWGHHMVLERSSFHYSDVKGLPQFEKFICTYGLLYLTYGGSTQRFTIFNQLCLLSNEVYSSVHYFCLVYRTLLSYLIISGGQYQHNAWDTLRLYVFCFSYLYHNHLSELHFAHIKHCILKTS